MTRVLHVALVLGVPTAARAASEGAMGFFWEVANLALLLGVLVFLARKPVLNYLAERRDTIRTDIETSEKMLRDAEQRLTGWQLREAQLDTEVASIREAARKSAEQEAASILQEARSTAERIRASARGTVDAELRRARESLRKEAAELAIELAAGKLRSQVTDADRDRLVDEFVTRIESGGQAG